MTSRSSPVALGFPENVSVAGSLAATVLCVKTPGVLCSGSMHPCTWVISKA